MRLPTYDDLPFWIQIFWNPVKALDLVDRHGKPDHTKIVPFLVTMGIFAMKLMGMPFTVLEDTVLLSAAFGVAAWKMFLRSKIVSGTFENKLSTTADVKVTGSIEEVIKAFKHDAGA